MNIYESIATRTNGNIYVGVVGPVRTGKSTFITRFMEKMVVPGMENNMALTRTLDELPQSGSGRQIMTMEPRFVPNEPVSLSLGKTKARVRLVDCVGYIIEGVSGHLDEFGNPRLVKTPWASMPITFNKASEIGTGKVITEHSTVGVLVTTDGTITDIDRENYISAEERTVNELKGLGKPFVIILNTITPDAEQTKKLAIAMEEKYGVRVLVKDIQEMEKRDFEECFNELLYEFPVQKLSFQLPDWLGVFDEGNEIVNKLLSEISKVNINKMSDVKTYEKLFGGECGILNPVVDCFDLGVGEVDFKISVDNNLFFKSLSSLTGAVINNDKDLMNYLVGASLAKKEYDKLQIALQRASETGYGVVIPTLNDLELAEPEVIKKSGTNGLKLKAKAPSLHIMRVDVETEVMPAVGGGLMIENGEDGSLSKDAEEIWNTNLFGRTMVEVAHDSIISKLNTFPEEAEIKLRKTLTKITNEGKGGIICILL